MANAVNSAQYQARTGLQEEVFVCTPQAGVSVVE